MTGYHCQCVGIKQCDLASGLSIPKCSRTFFWLYQFQSEATKANDAGINIGEIIIKISQHILGNVFFPKFALHENLLRKIRDLSSIISISFPRKSCRTKKGLTKATTKLYLKTKIFRKFSCLLLNLSKTKGTFICRFC